MRNRFAFVFPVGLGFLLALHLVLGCSNKSKKSPVVALVGNEEILMEEISGPLDQQGRLFASAEEELTEKRRLLDSIVETRLLVQESYRQKLDSDSLIRAFGEQERPLFLIDVLYFREVRDKVRLSKAEVQRFYRSLQVDRCYRQILTPHKMLADSLFALAHKGARFDSLATAHSRDRLSAPAGGDIGCYGWSTKLPEALFEKVVEMKPGELGGPFRTPNGWLLLQCYDQKPARLPDLKVFEPELRNLLEPYREDRRSPDFVAKVRKELDFRIVDSTARFVNVKQQELSKIMTPGQREESHSIYIRTEELTPAQRDMPLITYKGGLVTAGQYLDIIQGSMPGARMTLDTGETTTAMLFQLVFRDAMTQTAVSKKLDKDPEFLKLFKQAVEGQMAALLKNRIYSSVPFDTARVRAYYNAYPDEFREFPAVHLFEINRPSQQDITALKPGVRGKAQLMAAASQVTARTRLRSSGGDLGWVEQHQYPELFAAASKMKIGEIAGPVALADGSFSLIYLEAKRPSRKQSLAEVKDGLTEKLWIRAQDSALADWMEKQKKKIKVAVYPEVLKKTVDQTYYAKLKEWQNKQKEGVS